MNTKLNDLNEVNLMVNKSDFIIDDENSLLNLKSIALDEAANGVVITDIEGNIIWVNEGFTKLTGYKKEEVYRQNPRVLKSEKQDSAYYKNLWDTLLKGEIWNGELINKRKDGTDYIEEMTITPIRNAKGIIKNFIAIKQDITGRKKVEIERNFSQYKYRELLKNSTLGIIRIDDRNEIIMANPQMIKMLNYDSQSDLISAPLGKIFHSSKCREKLLSTLSADLKISGYENTFITKDGLLIDVRISGWIVKDYNNNLMYNELIIEDITEYKKGIQKLNESEFKFRQLINKLSEAVFLMIDGKIELANAKALELVGISEEELFEPDFDFMNFVNDNSKAFIMEQLKLYMEGEEIVKVYEIEIKTKTGEIKSVEISITDMNLNGQKAIQGIIRDLSLIKVQEMKIRHLQKMEAIGTLAAGIAHEINTPCQYINDNLTFMKQAYNEILPLLKHYRDWKNGLIDLGDIEQLNKVDLEFMTNELTSALDQSMLGVEKITSIVGAMRDFSHSNPKEKITYDLHNILSSAITLSKNVWKYSAVLNTEFDDRIESVFCYPNELSQVFINMIINSTHAIEDKFAEKNQLVGEILIKTVDENDNVIIIIKDNGTGMDENIIKRIFDPFFTTKEVGKGTGQGLAITYDIIVSKHGGKVDVESKMGLGTTFTIILPKNYNMSK